MSNATVSQFGQIQGAGVADALFLKLFGGEVLTAFQIATKLDGTIRTRSISGGKSAQFPATFRANGRYHTPGTEITGQVIQSNEVVITVDDLLIADAFVADIDELKSHFDVRGPYSTELGNALALLHDRTIALSVAAAARSGPLFTGDQGGASVIQTDVSGAANFNTSGADIADALGIAKQKLDTAYVPVDQMTVWGVLAPAQWYLLARSDKNLNQLYNGNPEASQARDSLKTIHDVVVVKSQAAPFGKNCTVYNATTNATGLVGASGYDALPVGYPAKYQNDLTNTRGLVYVDAAAACLKLRDIGFDSQWDIRRQGTLMLAKMAAGYGPLRSKCAVEIKTV